MVDNQLKKQTISGLVWKFAERIGAQATSLVVSIVLARLLMPEDYGAIALITIFISICDVFLVNGLSSPLIQKKNADSCDFSTIFYCSLVISIVLYTFIYLSAPLVASFYNMEILSPALRVLSIRVIFSSISSVQNAYVSKHMLFKKFFWGTIIGTIVSGLIGIYLAYCGYGIWALIMQQLVMSFMNMMVIFFLIDWRPTMEFSIKRFKAMWSFGWKILIAAMFNELFQDIRAILIGKVYTKQDLAYYNQGNGYPQLVVSNVNASIVSVLFPAISKIQDKYSDVKVFVRRSVKTSSFMLVPLLYGLAAVANPFVSLVLTDKWLPSVPYIQIMCVALSFAPISAISQQAIKAIGRSDITMKQEIIKKTLGLLIIIISVQISVFAIVIGTAITEFWFFLVNTYPCKKVLGYKYREQFMDLAPNLIISIIMSICVYLFGYFFGISWAIFALQILIGGVVYIMLAFLTKNESLNYLLHSLLELKTNK